MRRGTVTLALCLAVTSLIAATTPIRDTAYTGFGGQLFTRMTVTAPQMTTQDGRTILRWEQTYTVTNGVIALDLEPNDTATPPGTQYVVVYHPRSGPAWSERWSVPAANSTGTVRLNQVRVPVSSPPKIAPAGAASRYQDGEVPTGILDGTNRTFILALAPDPPASLILIRNGLVQRAGLDFTLTARTIEFVLGVPQAGDLLQAWYRF